MSYINISNLTYAYNNSKSDENLILKGISLKINQGELVAIQGPSGSGKSTLLYLLGCLVRPNSGKIEINGTNISELNNDERAKIRNNKIGFIFQQFHLLPKTSVLNNILLPISYSAIKDNVTSAKAKALSYINDFGLSERIDNHPNQLSGGQQQRVAIARALINDPEIILADEPTGNLDSTNAKQILELLINLNRELKKTIIIITHDSEVAKACDRIIHIKDGKVENSEQIESNINTKSNLNSTESIVFKKFNFWQTLKAIISYIPFAFTNLKRNKIRTILTMTGISVGVAAVISMVTLGQFTKNKILAGYAEMGVNTLMFHGYPNWEKKATDKFPTQYRFFNWEKDILPLKRIFPQIKYMSPMMIGWGANVSSGGKTINSEIRTVGINENALMITKRKLIIGRNFVYSDIEEKRSVCIIGYEIGKQLFSNLIPIGQTINISQEQNHFGCRVIGVLNSMTSSKEWLRPDYMIYFPFPFYQATSGNWWSTQIHDVILQIDVNSDIEKTGDGIKAYFEQKYGKSGRFVVDSDSVLLAQMKKFLALFTILLAAVAFVTLAVGGIGITNMMLVSVSERFREIGLRKAIGATDQSIRIQFLTEAIVVCLLAGIVGLILGFSLYHTAIFSATKFVSNLKFEWIFDWFAILLSIISIFVVGIFSGLFPALKAEKLQVIEALRSE